MVIVKHNQKVNFGKTSKTFKPEVVEQTFTFFQLGDALEFISAINTEYPLIEIRLYSSEY